MCFNIALYIAKLKDKFKKRMKETNCNWPEISLYCGLCQLSTGIYIKSFVTLIATSALISINYRTVRTLQSMQRDMQNVDRAVLDEYLIASDYNAETLAILFRSIIVYFIMWTVFKCFYIVMISLLIFSIYTKKAPLLKNVLYIIVPISIFDLFLSVVGATIAKYWAQIIALVTFFLEAYNLVAVSSEYKKLVGKSRIVSNELESRFELRENHVITRQPSHHQSMNSHCQSCTCLLEASDIERPTEIPPAIDVLPPIEQADTQVKELNFKDGNIIFDQNQLIERSNSVVSHDSNQSGSNASCVSEFSFEKSKKKDIADTPIIYDQSQLNVGMSPVVEDRPFIPVS